jgi:hypothetical protein
LGKAGCGELISYLDEASPDFQEMSSWFGGDIKSMQSGQSVTAPVEGTLTAGSRLTFSLREECVRSSL